jgi:hypothetical protein
VSVVVIVVVMVVTLTLGQQLGEVWAHGLLYHTGRKRTQGPKALCRLKL